MTELLNRVEILGVEFCPNSLNSAYPGFPEVGPARIVRSLEGFLSHGGRVSEGGGNTPFPCLVPRAFQRFAYSADIYVFKTVDGVRHQRLMASDISG